MTVCDAGMGEGDMVSTWMYCTYVRLACSHVQYGSCTCRTLGLTVPSVIFL